MAKDPDIFSQYEVVPDEARLLTEFILRVYKNAGEPDGRDYKSEAFWTVIDAIVKAWSGFYTQEFEDFKHDVEYDLKYERPIRDAIKADGGFVPVSYPPKLYMLLKAVFPEIKLQDKRFYTRFIQRYPIMKRTNAKIGVSK